MVVLSDSLEGRIEHVRSIANDTHSTLHQSRSLVDSSATLLRNIQRRRAEQTAGDFAPRPALSQSEQDREELARQRLLVWEAEDLARLAPEEIDSPRRQFARSLYETILLSQTLGMTDARLLYHIEYALDRFRQGE